MIIKLYAIRDNKVGVYKRSFEARNDNEAVRMCRTAAQNKETELGHYAEDFDLYHIADIDDVDGHIEMPPSKHPELIVPIRHLVIVKPEVSIPAK